MQAQGKIEKVITTNREVIALFQNLNAGHGVVRYKRAVSYGSTQILHR